MVHLFLFLAQFLFDCMFHKNCVGEILLGGGWRGLFGGLGVRKKLPGWVVFCFFGEFIRFWLSWWFSL